MFTVTMRLFSCSVLGCWVENTIIVAKTFFFITRQMRTLSTYHIAVFTIGLSNYLLCSSGTGCHQFSGPKYFPPFPGIVNVVMASAPLLKEHSQALLLSSFYLSTVRTKHLYQGTADFYEKLLCMNAHIASVLLGMWA